jgi:hypothetical protein
MKMRNSVTIKALTHKMKNRIKEHGDKWCIVGQADMDLQITPIKDLNSLQPYSIWIRVGKDIEIVNEEARTQEG